MKLESIPGLSAELSIYSVANYLQFTTDPIGVYNKLKVSHDFDEKFDNALKKEMRRKGFSEFAKI